MRPGPARGDTAELTVTVTPEMTARVAGREVHPVYGTGALVAHVEEICRSLLEPHLEEGEEGVGHEMSVSHRGPIPVGAELRLVATVANVTPRRLLIEVVARLGNLVAARASFEQRIIASEEFEAEIEAAQAALRA